MHRLTIVMIFLAAAAARNIDHRIINGHETKIEDYPYQVSIQHNNQHLCGGCLVKVDRVLTAAHCFAPNTRLDALQIRAGSTSCKTGGTVYSVASLETHPQFNKDALDFDVVVISLKKPVVVSASARPISLVPSSNGSPQSGEMLNITGWGFVSPTMFSSLATNLRTVSVAAVERSKCEKVYTHGKLRVTSRMFCAGGGNQGPFKGDSGGPVANKQGQLVGIVSWGRNGNITGYPGVYTDLTSEPIRSFVDKRIA